MCSAESMVAKLYYFYYQCNYELFASLQCHGEDLLTPLVGGP